MAQDHDDTPETEAAAGTQPAAVKPASKATSPKKVTKKGAAKKVQRKAQEPLEQEPVLSGRLLLAAAFVLAMVVIPVSKLGPAITKRAPQTAARASWKVGQTATVHITVVSSDYDSLGCASKRMSGKAHCEWENERERWPKKSLDAPIDDSRATTLQPYRTTDRNLLLIPGLWAEPEIATRLHNEPARGVGKNKLARFVVSCDVTFLEEWDKTLIRWSPSETWSDQGTAMVGALKSCRILSADES